MKKIHKALAFSMIGAASLPTLAIDFKLGELDAKFCRGGVVVSE